MGAGSSPAIAGRMGAAFIRKLEATSPYFQGEIRFNTWWQAFARLQPYNSNLSHDCVKFSTIDGLPAVIVFVHYDDFLLQ
jgi:hypothetical protein